MRKKIAEYNDLLAKLADGKVVYYLDVGKAFTRPDGTLDPIPRGRPAIEPAAFEHWADAERDTLTSLLKTP